MTTPTSNSNSNTEIDKACLEVINTKCYYKILKVEKTADENEIRRAYKKVLIVIIN